MHDSKLLVNADTLPKVSRDHPSVYCPVAQNNISVWLEKVNDAPH